jgi:hypothetical protein
MPTVSQAVRLFLDRTPHNSPEMAAWYHAGMELQVMASSEGGEPVADKRNRWSDGIQEWGHIRLPQDAGSNPVDNDYVLRWPLHEHAELIGMTGWDYQKKRSIRVGFDFDHIAGHAKGVGIETNLTLSKRRCRISPRRGFLRARVGPGCICTWNLTRKLPQRFKITMSMRP